MPPPEPGKSYELWVISDRLGAPRSLGVIGEGDFTERPALAAYDPGIVRNATYAVTVEPSGGSPNGKPGSAPVFAGKLIETVPQAAPLMRRSPCTGRTCPRGIVATSGREARLRDGTAEDDSTKRKRPWGAGVFGRLSQLGGRWGLNYPRGDFGGLVKSRVNS